MCERVGFLRWWGITLFLRWWDISVDLIIWLSLFIADSSGANQVRAIVALQEGPLLRVAWSAPGMW